MIKDELQKIEKFVDGLSEDGLKRLLDGFLCDLINEDVSDDFDDTQLYIIDNVNGARKLLKSKADDEENGPDK